MSSLSSSISRVGLALAALALAVTGSLASAAPALAAGGGDPAKGAPLDQVAIGTFVATALTALVIWTIMAHRSAGFLAIGMGAPEEVPTSVRLTSTWRAPLGGLLIFLCGGFALLGFPLDDVWHTLFGQDVTLWGPTHILMIGGASLATLGAWVLLIEGQRARHLADAPVRANEALLTRLLIHPRDHQVDDLEDLARSQGVEHDGFVDASEELRPTDGGRFKVIRME